MSQPHDEYKKLDFPAGKSACPCPVCGADAELWQFSKSVTSAATKTVMCANGDAFGPQDAICDEGCLLFMPPQGFYKATIREAIAYWNDYAKALQSQQRSRRWARAQVLRSNPCTTGAQP